jgi:hypothetical protein
MLAQAAGQGSEEARIALQLGDAAPAELRAISS